MKADNAIADIEQQLGALRGPNLSRGLPHGLARGFARRLEQVASHPGRIPITLNGARMEARKGATLLAAALRNQVRLMHVCGAQALCSTCRVKVRAGGENLTPMTLKERLSLRAHLAFSPRTRLSCQARVMGPVEVSTALPLCGNLPGE